MANIYDTINDLEKQIREQDVYTELSQAMEAVAADETAHKYYDDFRKMQADLQMKMQMGQEMSEEDVTKAQELQKQMEENDIIANLLNKEKQLNQLVEDINAAVTRPIREVYQAANQEQDQ